ncbi:MAG: ABC transporter substrate-binding protein [Clostridiales bacterium]|nr:ABC transporter substrate-binding protein [Clostridiales bacterium]
MKRKVIAVLLAGSMVAGMMAGCGSDKTTDTSDSAATDETTEETEDGASDEAADDEAAEEEVAYSNKQIVIGDLTETSGDYTPYWTNNASDYSVYKMITGLENVSVDADGKWLLNESAMESVETTDNEDGSKTYTYTIKDGLKFSDGSDVKADNYVAYYLLWASDEMIVGKEASAGVTTSSQYLKGFDAYSAGESDTFEGVHLIDDKTFSVTVDAKWLPYYYGLATTTSNPEVYKGGWLPEDVTIEDTEKGAKFSDNYTVEYISETVDNWRYNPTACSGPYTFDSYDENGYAYTLVRNENFVGTYDGKTANIETVIYKYTPTDTMMDQLKTGAVDMLLQIPDGDQIEAGLDMVDEGGFDYVSFPRAGYGMLSFKCNQGPTQFEEVRHAVAYLLDRNAFVQTFTKGHGTVVNGPYGSQQWMVEENAEEVEALNAYTYSVESAIKELEEGGWVYNEDGSDYTGEGIRHKKLEDGTYMPLVIEWFSSENNPVSDLLVTLLQENEDTAKAGMKINQTVGTFNDLIKYYYDNTEENPYQMFNLANGFGNPYDIAYSYEIGGESNTNAIADEKLYELADGMNRVEEGDDETYSAKWLEFMQYWNEVLPELPLYSNEYHDFFSDKVHDWSEDGYNTDASTAILSANIE